MYKVTMFGYEPYEDYAKKAARKPDPKKADVKARVYLTVKKGLTWQEAKDLRRVNRSLFIVPEAS